jgi:hypothetical protein
MLDLVQCGRSWPWRVTEANWRPGLPPPVEAIRKRFSRADGWQVIYCTWIEPEGDGGVREIPIAVVRYRDGREITFFPEAPTVKPC